MDIVGKTVTGMAKYIGREALVEWLKRIPLKDLSDGRGLCRVIFEDDFKRAIKKMPKGIIADVALVRHGRWIDKGEYAVCTECDGRSGTQYDGVEPIPLTTQFCPNCGAKMDGGVDWMDVREKLVELLKGAPYNSFGNKLGECYFNSCLGLIADHLIANGVTVQEWISASEPPKKITNKVIVLCKNGYMGYGHYEDYKGERTWYNLESGKPFTEWDLEDCESYEVTHWMPMPHPPKGE